MARVSITARPKKQNGTLPLYVRIEAGGVTRYVSLSYRIEERHWNPSGGTVRKSHPQYAKVKRWLAKVQAQAEEVPTEIITSGGKVTAARIKAGIRAQFAETDEPEETFTSFSEAVISGYERRGQIATAKSYRSQLGKLSAFWEKKTGTEEVPFSALTVEMLREFETYLCEVKKNSTNTVAKSLGRIRALLYQAIREGHFPQEKNPFFQISLKSAKVQKGHLSFEELEGIENLELEADSLSWHVRNYFLFAFYAGGMRFSDVALLQWKHVRGGRVRYKMKKTTEGAGIALVPQALAILDHYRDRDTAPEARVFPILDGYDLTTELGRHTAIGRANALVNKYLCRIQKQAKIETKLSFHLSRHSLAHYLQRKGWDVYRISKVLGHANVKITERYLSGFDPQSMDDDYRGAFAPGSASRIDLPA